MKKSKVVALIIGSVLGLGLIAGGFLFMQTFSRASSDKPEEVVATEVTASTAKITWKTGNDNVGVMISYGTTEDLKDALIQPPSDLTPSKEHSAVISGLSPNTKYYFVLGNEKEFKDEVTGLPWNFTTKSENETRSDLVVSPTTAVEPTGAVEPTDTPIGDRVGTCKETDCDAIKAQLGKTCSTQEYVKCIKAAQNPSPSN